MHLSSARAVGLLVLSLALAAAGGRAPAAEVLHWKCTTNAQRWQDEPDVALAQGLSDEPYGTLIAVDPKKTFQTIDGWGGCFNERGWKALAVLSPAARDAVMKSLFDPATGLKLTICRTPIGASDYAITPYSLDDTPGDYAMEHFSIERDKQLLIPFIKAAMKIQPALKVWAVPWSPPAWLKDNGKLIAGQINDDDRSLDALALYFLKYVQAYRAEGIDLFRIMPQNEPSMTTKYPSCRWTGKQLAKFVGSHLGPLFQQRQVPVEIFLGTFNGGSESSGYNYWIAPSMNDPAAASFIRGVGCQWGADVEMRMARFLHPELEFMQTEAVCGRTNSNDWKFAVTQFELAKAYLESGAEVHTIWNLVLDETGLNTAGWHQCSPIVVNSKTGQVTYTPYYYCYKHLSYFVQPGARRVATEGRWPDKLAFVNPDGTVVVVIQNTAHANLIKLLIAGREARFTLPAHSINTFTFSPPQKN
jgi:glucosylceramidase